VGTDRPSIHARGRLDLPPEALTIQALRTCLGFDHMLFEAAGNQVGDLPTWDW
jgi:hypothetical protein